MQYRIIEYFDPLAGWDEANEPFLLADDVQFQACSECGHRADIETFECLGADDGNVFCPQCWAEIPIVPDWREVPVSEEAARILAEEFEPEQPTLF